MILECDINCGTPCTVSVRLGGFTSAVPTAAAASDGWRCHSDCAGAGEPGIDADDQRARYGFMLTIVYRLQGGGGRLLAAGGEKVTTDCWPLPS